MQMTGADIIIECLLEQGVDTVFGYPGGAVLNIYDSLYKYKDKINHYLTSHEQHAAHAADGYARSTGKTGVCIATSGPGATNLVTGIATAYMDSVPMVAITGNVACNLLGKDSFQEVDIAGITMPVTKHGFIVKEAGKIAETIRKAFYIAASGRPGPVLVDITKDATAEMTEYRKVEPKPPAKLSGKLTHDELKEAAWLISEAKKPLIICGGGVIISDATDELIKFADLIDCPVTATSMGLGGFPASNPRFLGMIGMHGAKASNIAATESDLLIAIGARFSDRVVSNVSKFAPNSKILHIDIDPAEIDKNILSTNSLIGDVKEVLAGLMPMLHQHDHSYWMDYINEISAESPIHYKDDGVLKPQFILEKISELTKGEAIIATEVGQHQMWACHYIKFEKPRTLLTSGGLGTMGFGLGASIGASIANPGKTVFNIAGDGCFRMNNIELATAAEYNVPIIVCIMNNHALGMVRQWQALFYDGRFSQTTLDRTTDFVKLAESYKVMAFNVTQQSEVEETLKKAIAHNGPVVINFEISADEYVYPMVAPGKGIDEIVEE
ncbi:biosynthetic-type acetolactate synthase large subunit [Tyzzerella sp. OttesenSCG-928-J15]|nr:biosynthetic-type acetolactate synthase large subunit [Tyzzerella sp. OttesenSCG-928-J15]